MQGGWPLRAGVKVFREERTQLGEAVGWGKASPVPSSSTPISRYIGSRLPVPPLPCQRVDSPACLCEGRGNGFRGEVSWAKPWDVVNLHEH